MASFVEMNKKNYNIFELFNSYDKQKKEKLRFRLFVKTFSINSTESNFTFFEN